MSTGPTFQPKPLADALFGDQEPLRLARVKCMEAITVLITVAAFLLLLVGMSLTAWIWIQIFN